MSLTRTTRVLGAAGIAAALVLGGCSSGGSQDTPGGGGTSGSGTAEPSGGSTGDSGTGRSGADSSGIADTGRSGADSSGGSGASGSVEIRSGDSGASGADVEDGGASVVDAGGNAVSASMGDASPPSLTSCETTCGSGYVCVEDEELGGFPAVDDAGVCLFTGCARWGSYHCVAVPSSCIGSTAVADCACAASLCALDSNLFDPINGPVTCDAPSSTLMVCFAVDA